MPTQGHYMLVLEEALENIVRVSKFSGRRGIITARDDA